MFFPPQNCIKNLSARAHAPLTKLTFHDKVFGIMEPHGRTSQPFYQHLLEMDQIPWICPMCMLPSLLINLQAWIFLRNEEILLAFPLRHMHSLGYFIILFL